MERKCNVNGYLKGEEVRWTHVDPSGQTYIRSATICESSTDGQGRVKVGADTFPVEEGDILESDSDIP